MSNFPDDRPKSLGEFAEQERRLRLLNQEHIAPLTDFVIKIRQEQNLPAAVPYFDPMDGGTKANVLLLLEAPGRKAVRLGNGIRKDGSGFVSQNNDDETASNLFKLLKAAELSRASIVIWNAIPWYIGDGSKIRHARISDLDKSRPYLERLLLSLKEVRTIILLGNQARLAWNTPKPPEGSWHIYDISDGAYHPSPSCINRDRERRWASLLKVLHNATKQI